jgi:uncharacterized Zn-binding protein involved in type VI secretion
MRQPAAKQGDRVFSIDIHTVFVLIGGTEVAVPLPHLFNGTFTKELSANVNIMKRPAATTDSVATDPSHPHTPPGTTRFQRPPANRGQVTVGSGSVRINGQPAARHADKAQTCNDPSDRPIGTVIAAGSVLIG